MFIDHKDFPTPHAGQLEARRHLRQRVSASVEIQSAAFGHFEGRLLELSTGGCCVATPAQFAPGTPVTIAIAGAHPIPAIVVWSRGKRCGLRFGAIDYQAIIDQLLELLSR